MKQKRTRSCECAAGETCYDCPVHDEETIDCPSTNLCEFGEYSDYGNCVYHSECCDTIFVSGSGDEDGYYTKLYVEHNPYPYYRKVNTEVIGENNAKYIHFRTDLKRWTFSNNYWDLKYNDPDDDNLDRDGSSTIVYQSDPQDTSWVCKTQKVFVDSVETTQMVPTNCKCGCQRNITAEEVETALAENSDSTILDRACFRLKPTDRDDYVTPDPASKVLAVNLARLENDFILIFKVIR